VIGGFHIWPMLRIHISNRIILASLDISSVGKKNLINKQLNEAAQIVGGQFKTQYIKLKDRNKNQSISQPADLMFLGSQITKIKINNYWYDRFADPIVDKFSEYGFTAKKIDWSYNYRIPRYNPSVMIQGKLDMLKITSYISNMSNDFSKLKGFHNLIDDINTKHSLGINIKTINRNVETINIYTKWFERIIKNTKAKLAFLVCYYNLEGMAFCLACRKCGISSIEIQHGVQGDQHRAYGRWNQVPKSGYELLPSSFWCWSDHEVDAINSWSSAIYPHHQAFVGGHPWLDAFDESTFHKAHRTSYDTFIKVLESYDVKGLISLSGFKEYGGRIEDWVINYIRNSPQEWLWLIRVHPNEHSEIPKINDILLSEGIYNYEITLSSSLPLPLVLKYVDFNVTAYSSTAIEASMLKVSTIFTDEKGSKYFTNQIPGNYIYTAYDYHALEKSITEILNKPKYLGKHQAKLSNTVKMLIEKLE